MALKVILFLALVFLSMPTVATAQNKYYVISKKIEATFSPRRIFILIEGSSERLSRIKGYALPIRSADHIFLAGGLIETDLILNQSTIRVSFLLIGESGQFYATPIETMLVSELRQKEYTISGLETSLINFEQQQQTIEDDLQQLEEKFKKLRTRVAANVPLDELMQKRQGTEEKLLRLDILTHEVASLTKRVENGRNLSDSVELQQLEKSLSQDLEDAAKVTAVADRLSRRSRDAAVESARRKLAIVREYRDVNREQLARELLQLRQRRRQLEVERGLAPAEERAQDQF